jgi:hypothetical protein
MNQVWSLYLHGKTTDSDAAVVVVASNFNEAKKILRKKFTINAFDIEIVYHWKSVAEHNDDAKDSNADENIAPMLSNKKQLIINMDRA